jgi:hypothetical protein
MLNSRLFVLPSSLSTKVKYDEYIFSVLKISSEIIEKISFKKKSLSIDAVAL